MVALAYVTFLSTIGTLMLLESIAAIRKVKREGVRRDRHAKEHSLFDGLPFKMR